MNEKQMKAKEIMDKALDMFGKYNCMLYPVLVNKAVNASPVDREIENEIRRIAKENGLGVQFDTKSHKTTMIHGYKPIGGAPVTSSYVTKQRTMIAYKLH